MRFYRNLYAGEKASRSHFAIIRALRKEKHRHDSYVITRAFDSDGILEIYQDSMLFKDYYREKDPLVLGIAVGRPEAMEVARTIVSDLYARNGDFDIDAFCDPDNT